MGTTVTLNADPLYVDVEEDYTRAGTQVVTTYTMLKTAYTNKLDVEKQQMTSTVTRLNQNNTDNTNNVNTYNTRSTEIDDILTVVAGL